MPSGISTLRFIANEDGGVILDIDHNMICTLNPTGAYVWQELQRGQSLDTVIATFAKHTGEDCLRVEHDLHAFVKDLEQRHLLRR